MSLGIELQIRDRISEGRNFVYEGVPFSGIYRPISEVIGITPGIVIYLYGHPDITKKFILRYTTAFFNTENEIISVGALPDPNSKEMDQFLDSKTNLIVLDEVSDDKATANRIREFRKRRQDNNRILMIRASPGSIIDRLAKVGCETTYESDFFLPFPRRYPPMTEVSAPGKQIVPTDAMLYLWNTILPHKHIDRRRVEAVDKIFRYLSKLTGKYFRKEPKFNREAFESVMKTFKRYRNKDVPTISDIIAIVPLMMAPKMLVTGEIVKKRLQKAYHYVKRVLGEVDLDQLSEEDLLMNAELGGFIVFDVLRFAEGIIKYILST